MARPGGRRRQEVAERRAETLRLRRDGWSYSRIVRERPDLGYASPEAASKDVHRALSAVVLEQGRALLDLERERTDALQAAAFAIVADPQADTRDRVAAIREATRVLERRARLLGLDRAAGERRTVEDQDSARGIIGGFLTSLQDAYAQLPADTDHHHPDTDTDTTGDTP